MKCNICGSGTHIVEESINPDGTFRTVERRCAHGHLVVTHEVHTTMLADAREMRSAMRNITRRRALYERDMLIAADARPATVVAAEHQLTEARVRQIRTSFLARAPHLQTNLWPATNSERNES